MVIFGNITSIGIISTVDTAGSEQLVNSTTFESLQSKEPILNTNNVYPRPFSSIDSNMIQGKPIDDTGFLKMWGYPIDSQSLTEPSQRNSEFDVDQSASFNEHIPLLPLEPIPKPLPATDVLPLEPIPKPLPATDVLPLESLSEFEQASEPETMLSYLPKVSIPKNPFGGQFDFPTSHYRISTTNSKVGHFGYTRTNLDRSPKFHHGIDIYMPVGTDVVATLDGRVISTGEGDVSGYWIRIDHGSGIKSRYLHLEMILVKAGQNIKSGQVIGLSGKTGNAKNLPDSQAHLHFEIKVNNQLVDPAQFIGTPFLNH